MNNQRYYLVSENELQLFRIMLLEFNQEIGHLFDRKSFGMLDENCKFRVDLNFFESEAFKKLYKSLKEE